RDWRALPSCVILDVSSCAGRCGEGYARTQGCQCDHTCHLFDECCPDYKTLCSADVSCKGRCNEPFKRGRSCDCDADCERYHKCCPDYSTIKRSPKLTPKPKLKPKPKPKPKLKAKLKPLKKAKKQKKKILTPADSELHLSSTKGAPLDEDLDVSLSFFTPSVFACFLGHYYWLLDGENAPSPSPRKITEVWGIPSPIDTVFSRCNCDGKTFFFKDSQYWRFTNDKMDEHYPKPIIKGFGGLNGKIVTALSVGKHRNRPESVYFFKKGGGLQQYTYKQEGTKKCKKKVRTVKYPMYKPKAVIRKRRRFERAVRPHQIFRSIRIKHYPVRDYFAFAGVLQPEVQVASYWRGFPKEINSVISIPNDQKPDGYDYYAFSKDQYYHVDVGSRIARPVTQHTGQTVSSAWYKCPLE
uniref:SMB domain-containing protein n=1 Tax=Varanus komodoensis TaxID=61221 RepID=A0A8D2ISW9_VARKO